MGCDIELYVEKKERFGWNGVTGGRFLVRRDYELFAVLAGVRTGGTTYDFIPPRGIPSDLSDETQYNYYYTIIDHELDLCFEERQVLRAKAEEWAKYGVQYKDETKAQIANPDVHCQSWLTLDELTIALTKGHKKWQPDVDIQAIVTLMEFLEATPSRLERCPTKTRIVFWFDN